MNKTIAIIGGTQEQTFRSLAKRKGISITFHNGKTKRSPREELERVVKGVDCIVVLTDACSHPAMMAAKGWAQELNIPIAFHRSRGATGAVNMGLKLVS